MFGLLLQAFAVTALVWGFLIMMLVLIFRQNTGPQPPARIAVRADNSQRGWQIYLARFRKWLDQPGQHVRVALWIGAIVVVLITWISPEDSLLGGFRGEAASIAFVVIILDELNRHRADLEYKQSIKQQLASRSNDFALDAARIIVDNGWHQGELLRGAKLECANLEGAHLNSANLCGANLKAANLCGADLRTANLLGANLQAANLSGTDLRDANVRNANLEGTDFEGVIYNEGTKWSAIFAPPESARCWDTMSEEERHKWRQHYRAPHR